MERQAGQNLCLKFEVDVLIIGVFLPKIGVDNSITGVDVSITGVDISITGVDVPVLKALCHYITSQIPKNNHRKSW